MRRTTVSTALLLLTMSLSFSLPCWAVIETYDFNNDGDRDRYHRFVDELRCPKCQNQNLSGSNSPIAKDLRRELHRMIENGDNDTAIKDFMVKRYGNFVLYRPPVNSTTIWLWATPAILLFIAFIFVVLRLRSSAEEKGQPLTAQEQETLNAILQKYVK